MRVKTLTAVSSLALSLLLVLPGVALGQQRAVGEIVREINGALAAKPTSNGSYSISDDGTGKLVADKSDSSGAFLRWEIYLEDVKSIQQTDSGQVYLNCNEDVGRCARQTCNGVVANFAGCVRGEGATRQSFYSDALELAYEYDTRAMRTLEAAFHDLMALGLGM